MYKMSYFRFPELFGGQRTVDRVRHQDIPESPTLDVLEEAFTTENWIVRGRPLRSLLHTRRLTTTPPPFQVRIYKVKDLDALGRKHKAVTAFESGKRLKHLPVVAAPASAKKRRA